MSSHSSRDAFYYLLQFVTLAVGATALGNVWFALINKWTTSPNLNEYFTTESLIFGLSSLIIAGPAYLTLSWWIRRSFVTKIVNPASALRKWLSYFTMFVTAVITLSDGIGVLYTFLNGDFTVRFFLKALTILMISGSIFTFYLWDIRREEPVPTPLTHRALISVVIVLLITIVAAFVVVGSPKTRRMAQWDEQRAEHLRSIVYDLFNRFNQGAELPENNEQMLKLVDPETKAAYGYRKIDNDTFEVCATFALSAQQAGGYPKEPYVRLVDPAYPLQPDFTTLEQHPSGEQCFQFTAARSVVKPQLKN